MNNVLNSKKSDNWRTPTCLYNFLVFDNNFVDLFPYLSIYDQYEIMYRKQKLFINPPYSHLRTIKFRQYIYDLVKNDNVIYLLIPSRTDTKIFSQLALLGFTFVFFKGRLRFNDSDFAPFPSMMAIYDGKSPLYSFDIMSLSDFLKKSL